MPPTTSRTDRLLAAKVTRSSASELDRSNIARAFATSGLVLKRAQGVYVEDEKGKKYLDMTAGGTTAVGYSHPRLTKALVSQVSRGIDHIDRQTMITEKASELTDELKTFVPNPLAKGKAVFGHSGSDIIEKAIRCITNPKGDGDKRALPLLQSPGFHAHALSRFLSPLVCGRFESRR
ncbi:MAG: aminotransferase class III-fold pyridoxal phosphate-dependent enzyme [Thaumarchaeota archaeon]|nr:MAG: aminotransferase class III-fold pyridoxal phosphate-dependent enzyme [Nitrososphaerota archaeon]